MVKNGILLILLGMGLVGYNSYLATTTGSSAITALSTIGVILLGLGVAMMTSGLRKQ